MSGIGSTLRSRWLELAWAAFAAANVVVILRLERWETIPFHFVWVSLTLVYGLRVWRLRTTTLVLVVVCVATGGALLVVVTRGHEGLDELSEVPLMASMFLAMVWHARRRQFAVEESRRLAENEHAMLERQRDFVRDASHELRTPITVARGHAELILGSGVPSTVEEDIAVVLDELDRLSHLSERLLALAAAEHRDTLAVRPVSVEEIVRGIARRWGPAVDRRFSVDVRAPGTVPVDRERLELALDCVVENAVNATADGDPILVLADAGVGSDLLLEITDRGVGVPSDRLGTIFERFVRADGDRARADGGTGLGLSIVRAVVQAHGGDVSLDSHVGRGSTVRIRLPGFALAPSGARAERGNGSAVLSSRARRAGAAGAAARTVDHRSPMG